MPSCICKKRLPLRAVICILRQPFVYEFSMFIAPLAVTADAERQREFLKLFGTILRLNNILKSFDEFEENEILTEFDFQDYCSRYQDVRPQPGVHESEDISDDVVFEIELLKQIEINIDYILMLVQKYHDDNCRDAEVLVKALKAVDASPELRSKKDLIEAFISGTNHMDNVQEEWKSYISQKKEEELQKIIAEEKLKPEATHKYMDDAFRVVKTSGTDITAILPPMSPFDKRCSEKKQTVIDKLKAFFERFFCI